MTWQQLEPGIRALLHAVCCHGPDAFWGYKGELWHEQMVEAECKAVSATHPSAGASCYGPRTLHFNADNDSGRGIHAFHFGAYGCTHVVAFGRLNDALESAAETLKQVAPGMFTEPDYAGAEARPCDKECGDCNLCNAHREEAEADLTYTESGWLASWEWTVHTLDSLDAILAYQMEPAR